MFDLLIALIESILNTDEAISLSNEIHGAVISSSIVLSNEYHFWCSKFNLESFDNLAKDVPIVGWFTMTTTMTPVSITVTTVSTMMKHGVENNVAF